MSELQPPSITAARLRDHLASGGSPILIDVREAHEVAAGTLPGARHIPLGEIEARAAEIPKDTPVVMICQRGIRSQRAIDLLRPMRFERLVNLEGGYVAWQQAQTSA